MKYVALLIFLTSCVESTDSPYTPPAKRFKYEIQYSQGKYKKYDFTDTFTMNNYGCIIYNEQNDTLQPTTLCGDYKILPSSL